MLASSIKVPSSGNILRNRFPVRPLGITYDLNVTYVQGMYSNNKNSFLGNRYLDLDCIIPGPSIADKLILPPGWGVTGVDLSG